MTEYFLDANIVMYASGAAHPLREPCLGALRRAVEHQARLVTSAEVLQEILHRYFSIERAEAGRKLYHATVRLCRRVLDISESETSRALGLLLERDTMTARDALHVATMEAHGIERILSTDRHFESIAGIERIEPDRFLRESG